MYGPYSKVHPKIRVSLQDLDFMKAFDTVPHKRLMAKVKSYGIDNQVLNWIKAFLTGRWQRVCLNGSYSGWSEVSSGIPQGSVLGPLLFLIYINDLPDVSHDSEVYLFADDAKVFHEIATEEDREHLQEDITRMKNWTDKWLLRFHPTKCKAMSVGHTRCERFEYKLDDHVLEYSSCEKDLGVNIDENLTFEEHISEKVNKANSIMGLIRRTFIHLDKSNFVQLFTALVRPHLEYAQLIWSPHLKKHIELIENVQRRATKRIQGLQNKSYEERLKELNLPTLVYRRLRGDMIETYKMMNTYDQEVTPNLKFADNTLRGHSKKLMVMHAHKNVRKFSYCGRVAKTWNILSDETVTATSILDFEKKLDNEWKNEAFKYEHQSDPPNILRARSHNI